MKTDVQGRLSQTLENLIDEILAAKSQKNIDEPCKKFFKAFVGGRKNSIEHNKNWELLKGLRKSRLNELLFIISSEPPLLGIPLWLMGVVPKGECLLDCNGKKFKTMGFRPPVYEMRFVRIPQPVKEELSFENANAHSAYYCIVHKGRILNYTTKPGDSSVLYAHTDSDGERLKFHFKKDAVNTMFKGDGRFQTPDFKQSSGPNPRMITIVHSFQPEDLKLIKATTILEECND